MLRQLITPAVCWAAGIAIMAIITLAIAYTIPSDKE